MARRTSPREPGEEPSEAEPELFEVDLHGLSPSAALRRLEQELHTVRVRGASSLRVITGRGLGNREQKPVLRDHVEAWLRDVGRARFGVCDVQVERSTGGGSLRVQLRAAGRREG